MWFATNDGLNKFDGYKFTVYRHNPNDKKSLNCNSVTSLFEDKNGDLWISTLNGLNRYDRWYDKFIQYNHWPKDNVFAFLELHNGKFYIASRLGLYLYRCQDSSFHFFSHAGLDTSNLNNNHITNILQDTHDNLWISTLDGLNLMNCASNTLFRFKNEKSNKNSISDNDTRSLCMDSTGRVWVGTNTSRLNFIKYDRDNPEHSVFMRYQHDPEKETSISNGAILALLVDQRGYLWIGTDYGGLDILDLNHFNADDPVFYHYRHDPYNSTSISSSSIQSIYKDREGNIWIGTYGDGVNVFNPLAQKFDHYQYEPHNDNSLSNNSVKSFYEDNEQIWIGTEGGLNLFDEKKKTFSHFIHDPYDNRSLGANTVLSIYKDSRDNLWIGTVGGGLN